MAEAAESGTYHKTSNSGDIAQAKNVPKPPKITTKNNKLRRGILDKLVEKELITKDLADNLYSNPQNLESENKRYKAKYNNYIGGLPSKLTSCFLDFINFDCKDPAELDAALSEQLVDAEDYGLHPEEFGFDENGKDEDGKYHDISKLTALDMLKLNCCDSFFSFCTNTLQGEDDHIHCPYCHRCQTDQYWHCMSCDCCAVGQGVCCFCGVDPYP